MLQTISILLENKPGALLRVTGVLSARGYNIESLTVAKTLDPELSRMTIVVDVEDRIRTQVIKQINKLVNVLQASDLTESPAVMRGYGEIDVARSGTIAMSLETKKLRLQPPVAAPVAQALVPAAPGLIPAHERES